jgi:hypothetical protein
MSHTIQLVKLDRVIFLAELSGRERPPQFPHFRRLRDWFVRSQTSVRTYPIRRRWYGFADVELVARTREYSNDHAVRSPGSRTEKDCDAEIREIQRRRNY